MNAFMRAIEALERGAADFYANPGYRDFVLYPNYASAPSPRCTWCVWFVPTPSWECN